MTLKWSLNPKLVALLTSNGWLVFLRPSFAEKVSGIAGHQEANTKGKFSTGPHCFLETQGEKRKVDLWKPSCCLWEYWVHELTVIHRQSSGWKADCRSVSRIEERRWKEFRPLFTTWITQIWELKAERREVDIYFSSSTSRNAAEMQGKGQARVEWGPRRRLCANNAAWAGPSNPGDTRAGRSKQASEAGMDFTWRELAVVCGMHLWSVEPQQPSHWRDMDKDTRPLFLQTTMKKPKLLNRQAFLFRGKAICIPVSHTEGWEWVWVSSLVIFYCL